MWVEEVESEVLAAAEARWRQAVREEQGSGAVSTWIQTPPGPLHIVVPWMDAWRPRVLQHPLDPLLRETHWRELNTHPLA